MARIRICWLAKKGILLAADFAPLEDRRHVSNGVNRLGTDARSKTQDTRLRAQRHEKGVLLVTKRLKMHKRDKK